MALGPDGCRPQDATTLTGMRKKHHPSGDWPARAEAGRCGRSIFLYRQRAILILSTSSDPTDGGAYTDGTIVDERDEFDSIINYLSTLSSEMAKKVNMYNGKQSLFDYYGLEEELEKLKKMHCII